MNFLTANFENRVLLWRDLRYSLKDYNEYEQMFFVNKWWSNVPFVDKSIDYHNPKNWPTAWDLIYNGCICRRTLAFLMEKTFLFSNLDNWKPNRFKYFVIKNVDDGFVELVLIIDNIWVLNYDKKSVFNLNKINNEIKVLDEFYSSEYY